MSKTIKAQEEIETKNAAIKIEGKPDDYVNITCMASFVPVSKKVVKT